jgi:hypothetical protein
MKPQSLARRRFLATAGAGFALAAMPLQAAAEAKILSGNARQFFYL